jgi:preprotein translocase subunit YajC
MKNVWIIAQTGTDGGSSVITSESIGDGDVDSISQVPGTNVDPNQVATTRPGLLDNPMMLIFWGLMIVMMYFMMVRGPKKKQKQHTQMVEGLSKNDRIRTVGGIIGTVIEVKGEEVVLKIDESNNTKIRIAASAIGKNLSKDSQ